MSGLHNNPDSAYLVTNPRTQKQYLLPKSIALHSYRLQDLRPSNGDRKNCYTVGDVWKMIITNAHATGEPGVCFIDRVNEDNPTPSLGKIHATNPCGEQPLLDYEACNLGSLNVSKFVLPDGSDLDWQNLSTAIHYAVRFLDNVIDVNYWPIPQIQQMSLGNRKIGLGIMGFADALVLLGIRYDSEKAVCFAKQLGQFLQHHAHATSSKLAEKKGCFPNWQGSIWDSDYHTPMRNAACTTIAPTGSISIIAQCSSGIEPIFSLAYKRRALDGEAFVQLHPLLEELGTAQGWMNETVKTMLMSGIDVRDIPGTPERLAEVLVTAHQIAPEWHLRIQAALQSNLDNAVSKTVNLPADATVEEVEKIFQFAFELRCKGVTVYRDSSRDKQVLSLTKMSEASEAVSLEPRSRIRVTTGKTSKFRMGCGTLFVTVNQDEKGLCEVFANLGKAGGCPSQSEATCRAISAALRSGVAPTVIIDQLAGIRCLSTAVARKTNQGVNVLSCPDAIAQALEEALGLSDIAGNHYSIKKCPDCGQILRFEAGCDICKNCGYSKCG
ncbi:MAG: adenosylcobalamin-dependent ribonucleoside-diphosphate reductase [Sedimentisphaerales bacterium]|nr:adenosylcobalamin-dependent ribonucleoside-diphosphate reductase [Sedimentisphaerales bacterium]